ncbi:MAG: helicase C-terminal domain-containing protein [Candidatus Gracilibacteria bacterium]|nr:helicase C-terminal domain-containing protein [Candidatus Gracilibacteria bacterium]
MIVALDLETTGLSKEKDAIIEVALIKFDENTFEIVEEYKTLVNPGFNIPELNINITGITDEMVENSPKFEHIKQDIEKFIGESPILGHNTYFDRDFLIEKGINITKNIVLDTFFLANILSQKSKSMSLESLTKYYNVELIGAHRAYNDTLGTVNLFKELVKEFNNLSNEKKELLNHLFFTCKDKNIVYLRQLLFNTKQYINFNEFVKLQLNNLHKYDYVIVKEEKTISNEDIMYYFNQIPNFEDRENQTQMSKKILENFSKGKKTVIEAPTGIGKTFAYLIPAIIYSKKHNKKIFISTKTKVLQDQIYQKDLQTLKDEIDIDFTYTKIKGRKNYISLKSYFDFIVNFDIDYEKLSFLSKITLWLCNTEFGELDELFYTSNEYKFLKYINADNKETINEGNPFLKEEFLYKQKIKLDNSDIIIINHSLLFTDLKNDFSFFGKLENLIIDEAHSVEDIATESLKNSFSFKVLEDTLSYLELIHKNHLIDSTKLRSKKEDLLLNIKEFFDIFKDYLKKKTNNENYLLTTLIDQNFYKEQDVYFYTLGAKIKVVLSDIKEILLEVKYDFSRELGIIDNIVDILNKLLDKESEEFVKISYFSEYEGVKLEYTILDIGKYLKNNFWDKLDNCFLFSATISIGESFKYIKNSLKLDEFEFLQYNSDFDYENQAILYIPNDIGHIKNNFSKVLEFLKEIFTKLGGNTLVLFTSLAAVRNVYLSENMYLKSIGTNLLAQSISGSKNKLLENFLLEPDKSIILGTDSFWEGIDIPGEPLKYLIIHKMPFMVPTDPLYVSRSKLYENPFNDYSIPKSILKLKQGFGRLIRTKQDKGVVIFLDDRIHSTDWGKVFINAFPKDIKTNIISKKDIINNI